VLFPFPPSFPGIRAPFLSFRSVSICFHLLFNRSNFAYFRVAFNPFGCVPCLHLHVLFACTRCITLLAPFCMHHWHARVNGVSGLGVLWVSCMGAVRALMAWCACNVGVTWMRRGCEVTTAGTGSPAIGALANGAQDL
jgi:hypothetical protein